MINKLLLGIVVTLFLISCSGKKDEKNQYSPPPQATQSETKAELEHPGKALFKQHCSVCHQVDGSGAPGLYPPLINSEYVQGDVKWLITTIVKGREGPITVKGQEYNNVMPGMPYLTDAEIANILSYVRQSFENKAEEVSESEVSEIRKTLE